MCLRHYFLSSTILIVCCISCSTNSGARALLEAIEALNHDRVVELLNSGANPLVKVRGKDTPLKAALLHISGESAENQPRSYTLSFDTPSVAILRDVMKSVRDREYKKIEMKGNIELWQDLGKFSANGIPERMTYLFFVPDDGSPKIQFYLALMETELVGAGKSGRGAAIPINTNVHFEGYKVGETVEATRIEVIDVDAKFASRPVGGEYFFPSTMDRMVEHTWIEYLN